MGMRQGPATLVVEARDRSWRNWLKGNSATKEFAVVVDTTPPRLGSLSQIIRLNRGGTGLAVYTVDEDQTKHGVRVGDRVFFGWAPWPRTTTPWPMTASPTVCSCSGENGHGVKSFGMPGCTILPLIGGSNLPHKPRVWQNLRLMTRNLTG